MYVHRVCISLSCDVSLKNWTKPLINNRVSKTNLWRGKSQTDGGGPVGHFSDMKEGEGILMPYSVQGDGRI